MAATQFYRNLAYLISIQSAERYQRTMTRIGNKNNKTHMAKDHFNTLSEDHPLFQKLNTDNPAWWKFVKDNIVPNGFYVDVRKDNSLNVYYNGGSLIKVQLSRGGIKGRMHEKYLGYRGAKYVDYDLNRLPHEAVVIKEQIASHYSADSENGIKARLICAPDARYIDSEFAFPEIVGNKTDKDGKNVTEYLTTRIDLTKLENGKIVFVELKRIQDGRLLTKDPKNNPPEILSQMNEYQTFVSNHKQEITEYYKTLFTIKRKLGVLPKSLSNIDISDYELSKKVELYIEPYSELNSKRKKRVEAIKEILDQHNIVHNL